MFTVVKFYKFLNLVKRFYVKITAEQDTVGRLIFYYKNHHGDLLHGKIKNQYCLILCILSQKKIEKNQKIFANFENLFKPIRKLIF